MSSKATASSPSIGSAPNPATTELALKIAERLDQKQASDIKILDVSGPLVIADYFVVATVQSTRQAQALAKEIDMAHKATRGRRKRNTSGMESENSNWVLLDFDDIVVHLFLPEARKYYGLEELWADVPRLPFTAAPRSIESQQAGAEVRQPTLEGFGAFQPVAGDDGDEDFDDELDDGLDSELGGDEALEHDDDDFDGDDASDDASDDEEESND
ncbi:MAG: ribosome silencing factor [Planctomycetota bacterium]